MHLKSIPMPLLLGLIALPHPALWAQDKGEAAEVETAETEEAAAVEGDGAPAEKSQAEGSEDAPETSDDDKDAVKKDRNPLSDVLDLDFETLRSGARLDKAEHPTLPSENPLSAAELYQVVKDSVVVIHTETSLGAGFLVKNQRLIATAFHVIEDGTSISVTSKNGVRYEASLYAYDEANDLAVLELDRLFEDGLPLPLQLSMPTGVGEKVAMVGHPFGDYAESDELLDGLLTWTITSGIVGATSEQFIQTDAASSPGNSGGPILDMHGQVLGVVSRRMDGAEGLTFSVPVSILKDLLDNPGNPEELDLSPIWRNGIGLFRRQGPNDLWLTGISASWDRLPRTGRMRWVLGLGLDWTQEVPENTNYYAYGDQSFWFQLNGGPQFFKDLGFGALNPTVGLRVARNIRDVTTLLVEPTTAQCDGPDCEWIVVADDTGSAKTWAAYGSAGLDWVGEYFTLGGGALMELSDERKIYPSVWLNFWI